MCKAAFKTYGFSDMQLANVRWLLWGTFFHVKIRLLVLVSALLVLVSALLVPFWPRFVPTFPKQPFSQKKNNACVMWHSTQKNSDIKNAYTSF